LRATVDYVRIACLKVHGIGADDKDIRVQPRKNLGAIRRIETESNSASWPECAPITRDWRNCAIHEKGTSQRATVHAEAEPGKKSNEARIRLTRNRRG